MAITRQIVSKSINATATTYVGKDGEVWADPVNNTLRIGDGTTAGGILLTGGGGGGGTTTWATLGDKNNANGPSEIALGESAGLTNQSDEAIAIGKDAGTTTQGYRGIAIGKGAGTTTQGQLAIAIGYQAGETAQESWATAVGFVAGTNTQGEEATAVGAHSGQVGQGAGATAIGVSAGNVGQGADAVAIGKEAGPLNQAANSIVINATGNTLNNTQAGSLRIKPVRNASGTHSLEYNPTTGEVTYDTLGGSGSGLQSRGGVTGTTSSLADAAQADLDITGFKSYALLTITTDRAARVRLYVSAATRTADASRAEGVDPTSDAGLIAEVITTGAETVIISPGAIGFNLESSPTTNIPCRVTNKSGGTSTVQVGLNILQLEA